MGFFDLNIPYVDGAPKSKLSGDVQKNSRVKLVVKSMELGYSGIAYNFTIKGVMSDVHKCSISPLPLSSLLQLAPSLSASVKFHREILGVPAESPFRQYTRLTVVVESMVQAAALNSGNPVLKSYDLVAVRPMNQATFEHACQIAKVDLIAIDFSQKLPFRIKSQMVKLALKRGVYFELVYSPLLSDMHARREIIAGAKLLTMWTGGKNIILSSGAPSVNELRGPYDAANLSMLLGLSMQHAKAAVSRNCWSLLAGALTRKNFHKESVRVENIPVHDRAASEKACFSDWSSWDPISSGDGDLFFVDKVSSVHLSKGKVMNSPPSTGEEILSVEKEEVLLSVMRKHVETSPPSMTRKPCTLQSTPKRITGVDGFSGTLHTLPDNSPSAFSLSELEGKASFLPPEPPSLSTYSGRPSASLFSSQIPLEYQSTLNITFTKEKVQHSNEEYLYPDVQMEVPPGDVGVILDASIAHKEVEVTLCTDDMLIDDTVLTASHAECEATVAGDGTSVSSHLECEDTDVHSGALVRFLVVEEMKTEGIESRSNTTPSDSMELDGRCLQEKAGHCMQGFVESSDDLICSKSDGGSGVRVDEKVPRSEVAEPSPYVSTGNEDDSEIVNYASFVGNVEPSVKAGLESSKCATSSFGGSNTILLKCQMDLLTKDITFRKKSKRGRKHFTRFSLKNIYPPSRKLMLTHLLHKRINRTSQSPSKRS